MASFILILICFALGILFRRFKVFPPNAHAVLNRFVIYVSLPALTLSQIHRLNLEGSILVPVSMSWILYFLGLAYFYLASRMMTIPKKTLGSLMLTGSFGNTSFVGFPLLEALYGASAIAVGILVDQPGTFLAVGSLGVATAAYFSGTGVSPRKILHRVFSFPPFLVLLLAFALRGVPFSDTFFMILDRLGGTLVPLSLISVGMQLHFHPEKLRSYGKYLFLGLSFKLLVAPVFFLALYVGLFQQYGDVVLFTILESAMAPMITAGIIAAEYDLDVEVSNLMIGIGIPISLVTVPLWSYALEFIR